MPLYEYQCVQCNERLEAIQRFSDEPFTICPQCGGNLKKLISSPAFQFKGSGWYVSDYGKGGSGSKGSSETQASSSESSGSSSSGTSTSESSASSDTKSSSE
jgi:putative FmdB family regulatory protein